MQPTGTMPTLTKLGSSQKKPICTLRRLPFLAWKGKSPLKEGHTSAQLLVLRNSSIHVQRKVQQWTREIDCLATITLTQPHAAYAAFTHGLTSKWTYLTRTPPSLGHLLKPLEDVIRTELLPAITGRPPPNDSERDLLALPTRLGGIALVNPMKLPDFEYSASIKITEPLTNAILQ